MSTFPQGAATAATAQIGQLTSETSPTAPAVAIPPGNKVIAAVPNTHGGALIISAPAAPAPLQEGAPQSQVFSAPMPGPVPPVYDASVPPPAQTAATHAAGQPMIAQAQGQAAFRQGQHPSGEGLQQQAFGQVMGGGMQMMQPAYGASQFQRPQFMSQSESKVMYAQPTFGQRLPHPSSLGSIMPAISNVSFEDELGLTIKGSVLPEDMPEIRALIRSKILKQQMSASHTSLGSHGSVGSQGSGSFQPVANAGQPMGVSMDAETLQNYILMMLRTGDLDPAAARVMRMQLEMYNYRASQGNIQM